ncbi:C6 zinc finger domain [Fusarium albosuccineum]|uniref:C6 zinc finger domain n=1 Tax=Fusarium albosuccineum TaxID=1237068 RepID=A0A8H4L970_9HYPO|nr:C6 zinc finger domain [Fusarium albosuccineum]
MRTERLAQNAAQSPQVRTPSRTPRSEDEALLAHRMDRFGEDEQQELDSWLNSPSQWDYMMPPDPIGMVDAAPVLLLNEEPTESVGSAWECSDLASGMAWTVAEDSLSSSFGTPSRGLDDLLNSRGGVQIPMIPIPQVVRVQEEARSSFTPTEPSSQVLMESRQQSGPDLPRGLFNIPTALSEYFFREVISLYCAWDSKSNVMRSIVESMWQSSGALHHTIQSMAAACLSEDFPHLLSVARQEHAHALELIKTKVTSSTQKQAMVLAATFLGHTSSWLSPHNLATGMFKASCDMLDDMAAETELDTSLSFFNDTMDYWAMLLAYLTDSQQLGDYRRNSGTGPTVQTRLLEPHPYCGISHEMIKVLRDTGILIFRYRKHMSTVKFMTEKDVDVFRVALREARRLERILLAHRPPDLSQVKDPGDPKTPLKHLELMDEAYQYTGLLQLYHVFPDLLNERYAPWDKNNILRPLPADKTPTVEERQFWLTKLAMHILAILRDIPFESRTRSAQPFIMVAVSSELRRNPQHLQTPGSGSAEIDLPIIDQASIEVARARKFLGSRLAAYTHILPLRKSRVIFELINHVWAALDAGEQDVYWLDVAYEKNLGTMMG